MNDDLERRLREGLRRGVLPPAPDALRERLAQLPSEAHGSAFSRFFSGLRLAALASAAAVAIAFVLVVRSLPGTSAGGPAPSVPAVASAGSSASASAAPTIGPSIGPSNGPPSPTGTPVLIIPVPSPLALPGFTCAALSVLPATTKAVTQITYVRVGTHDTLSYPLAYDRVVFEFAGSGRPQLKVDVATPPFVGDASGLPINVPGKVFLTLRLYDASGYATYTGPDSFSPGYTNLVSLVNTGDFEGYVTWVTGLNGPACYRISTLTAPTRIVVDVQVP